MLRDLTDLDIELDASSKRYKIMDQITFTDILQNASAKNFHIVQAVSALPLRYRHYCLS